MPEIRVVTDSACDLPPALVTELGIEIVPLTVRFGETELVDRRDLTPSEFWARCDSSPQLPETAAPSPGAFEEAFRRLAGEGATGVTCICLSAALSATHQSAELAARAVAEAIPVRVVDSRSVSLGEGRMAMAAAQLAAAGKSLDDVAGAAQDLVARTRLYAALDTLENLKKGGRIGGAQAMIGTMLSIKPIIKVVDGKVEQEAKPRTRGRSLRYMVDATVAQGRVENLSVVQADAADADDFVAMLRTAFPGQDVLVSDVGAVIGTHVGRGAMGVIFHVPR